MRPQQVIFKQTTASTNDDARALAANSAPEKTFVIAAHQSAGRGRLGRAWESPQGGVYLSGIFRPRCDLARVPAFALVTALAVREALESLLPLGEQARITLKWPNDVLLDTACASVGDAARVPSAGADMLAVAGAGKLAGILLETSTSCAPAAGGKSTPQFSVTLVVGIGINVNRLGDGFASDGIAPDGSASDSIAPAALLTPSTTVFTPPFLPTYLSDVCGCELETRDVGLVVADALCDAYDKWVAGGHVFAPQRCAYESCLGILGQEVCVRDREGAIIAAGIARGIDDEGRLLVGDTPVVAGEVTLR